MRTAIRALPVVLLAAVVVSFFAAPAAAFHDGGVAHCNGCHTMHNSENGRRMGERGSVGQGINAYLLKTVLPSDTCLLCHGTAESVSGYGVFGTGVLTPKPEKGGGDFVFLLEDNLNDGHGGATNPIPGYAAGHNIISHSKGIARDPILHTAPGGNFSSANLACTSCHDPHGTDAFRILYGANRVVKNPDGSTYVFNNPAPDAVGVSLFGAAESNTNHTAYLSGMSAWCANCHGDFHNNAANFIHPSGVPIGGTIAAIYNAYNGTTDCVNNPPTVAGQPCGTGVSTSAYLAQVPFEDSAAATNSPKGPTASSKVMCLTCHRAHATSAPDAGRWDFNVTLLAQDGVESGSYALPNPYDANQRSLCNKCHAQDEYDKLPEATAP